MLALLFSLSSQELLADVQTRLEQEVAGARDDIEFRNGKLKFDSDLLDLDYGVYLSVYSSEITGYGVVDVRGITSITEAESSFSMTLRLAVILLPLLVMVTAVLGYFMAGKTLRPVKVMTDTVCSIQKDGNLSMRIHLGEGKNEFFIFLFPKLRKIKQRYHGWKVGK